MERWQAYLTDDEPPEFAFYCPDRAEPEFDELRVTDASPYSHSDSPLIRFIR